MRTLLLHHGALGDWMLVIPMLRALIEQDPSHVITAGQSHAKSNLAARLLPSVLPLTIDTPAWADLFSLHATPPNHVTQALQNADHIISFLSTKHDAWSANVQRLAPDAKLFHLQARPENPFVYSAASPANSSEHITTFHANQLAAQGLHYTPAKANTPRPKHPANTPILIHPGSGGKHKNWPTAQWESFITHTQNVGRRFVPILGEVELETWPADTLARWQNQFAAVSCHTLDDLYDMLQSSRGLIGHDSGPAHLAAAMNLPTITLFGPTEPNVWSPFGNHVHVIAPPTPCSMNWLRPEKVLSVLEEVF